MSGIRLKRSVLLEILITGATGLPVGVPRPVENNMMFAPAPPMAVVNGSAIT